jgi:copper chaperone CopZ
MPRENCPFEPKDNLDKDLPFEERQVLSFAQIHISGMGCAGCESLIRNSLLALPGVVSAEVDRSRSWAEVVFNPQVVAHQVMLQAIDQAGGSLPKYHALLVS